MTRSLKTYDDPRSVHPDAHAGGEPEPGAIPLARLVAGLFRHRRAVAFTALLAVAGTAAYGVVREQSYVSYGSFLIKRGGEEIDVRQIDEGPSSQGVGRNVPHVLLSTELLRRVVEKIGVTEDQAGAIEALRAGIEINVPKRSSLVEVALETGDQYDARDILRIYMEEAIAHHVDVYSDHQSIDLIRHAHTQAVAAVEAALQREAALAEETGIVEFGAELEARRNDLAAALRDRQNLVRETKFEHSREPRIVGLRGQMRDLENRLVDLRTRLQPGDLAIVNAERTIDELRTRAYEIAEQHAEFLREDVGRRIQAASASIAELAPFEARYRAVADTLEKRREQLARAEAALERANHKQLLASNQVSALTILDHASLPLEAEGVTDFQLLLRALGIGVFAGIGYALLRTLTDRRIRSVDDIEKLGAPVLATIPNLSTKHIHRHNDSRKIG